MATAGHNPASKETQEATNQAQGADYGFPAYQNKGSTPVKVSADVADRFEAAKERVREQGTSTTPVVLDEKHKSGMEPAAERVRDLKEVVKAKTRMVETRTPEAGFPSGVGDNLS